MISVIDCAANKTATIAEIAAYGVVSRIPRVTFCSVGSAGGRMESLPQAAGKIRSRLSGNKVMQNMLCRRISANRNPVAPERRWLQ